MKLHWGFICCWSTIITSIYSLSKDRFITTLLILVVLISLSWRRSFLLSSAKYRIILLIKSVLFWLTITLSIWLLTIFVLLLSPWRLVILLLISITWKLVLLLLRFLNLLLLSSITSEVRLVIVVSKSTSSTKMIFIHILLFQSWLFKWVNVIESETEVTFSTRWSVYFHWCLFIAHITSVVLLLILLSSLLLFLILRYLSTATLTESVLLIVLISCWSSSISYLFRRYLPIVAIIWCLLVRGLISLHLVLITFLEVVTWLRFIIAPTDAPLRISS